MIRQTIRFNDEEEAKLKQVLALIGAENDISKAVKFSVDWTLNHMKIVTDSLISNNWEVFFRERRLSEKPTLKVWKRQ